MESLENKLDRLSPEQRNEVVDFVDFLLSRSGRVYTMADVSFDPLPVQNVALPQLTLMEPVQDEETRTVGLQDPAGIDERAVPAAQDEAIPVPFQEIGSGSTRITHDYMDYGQFEHQPLLATDAVKKVKRKIIVREGQEKPRHLLDWVD